ncbi:CLUMA_CG004846, isoform A [Clunio marinus]|uniref:CLUMA_CG004846, isoform A n=1 Tax=Clunio marinus TaxID=568069 RepID=A0A1J1HYF0_9DIPT|nr:CLUMA_CG004846, isoform A [Clunio marinus]
MSDLRSMCRICMTKENLTSVFSIMDGGKISDKINFVCGITISSSDVFPKLICHQCLSSIIIASSIKRKAIETEQIFSEMFSMIVDDLTDESIEYIEEKNDNSDDEKSSLLIEMKEDENQFLVYEEDPEIKGQPKMNYNLSEQSVKINNLNHFNYNSELKNFVGSIRH